MRVLQVITGLGVGGAETLLYNNLKELLNIENFETKVIYLKGEGTMRPRFEEKKISVSSLHMKAKSDNFNKKYENKLLEIIDEYKPDIIHTHLIQADIFVKRILLKYKLNIKVVYTIHNMYPGRKIELVYYRKLNKAYKKNSYYIGISKGVIQSWHSVISVPKEKMKVLYNYTDFEYQNKLNKNYNKKNFLYVGRLEKVKGVDILLKAFKSVEKKENNIKLDIVGDGSELTRLIELSKELNLRNIEFHGLSMPQSYYNESTIFVLPSRSEGFGISILEAWTFRNIVIASKTGGIKEIVRNNENGFLFTTANENELAKTMTEVINMPYHKYLDIENESKKDLNKYNKDTHIKSLLEYYEIINKKTL